MVTVSVTIDLRKDERGAAMKGGKEEG